MRLWTRQTLRYGLIRPNFNVMEVIKRYEQKHGYLSQQVWADGHVYKAPTHMATQAAMCMLLMQQLIRKKQRKTYSAKLQRGFVSSHSTTLPLS